VEHSRQKLSGVYQLVCCSKFVLMSAHVAEGYYRDQYGGSSKRHASATSYVTAASTISGHTLRVGTLNFHRCSDDYDLGVSMLKKASVDILGVQEITAPDVAYLASALGLGHFTSRRGVSILSRFPLDAMTSKSPSTRADETRWCRCVVSVPNPRKFMKLRVTEKKTEWKLDRRGDENGIVWDQGDDLIAVTCLHLDHRLELTRLMEFRSVVRCVLSNSPEYFERNEITGEIWLGDFNSLTRSDYGDGEWRSIAETRRLNSWEYPTGDLTSCMMRSCQFNHHVHQSWRRAPRPKSRKNTKKENRDSGSLSKIKCGGALLDENDIRLVDAWVTAGPNNISGPFQTSRFGTRTDYVCFSTTMINKMTKHDGGFRNEKWAVQSCEHIDFISRRASDHNLVIATLVLR